jgi:hypothetical protein
MASQGHLLSLERHQPGKLFHSVKHNENSVFFCPQTSIRLAYQQYYYQYYIATLETNYNDGVS